MKRTKDRLDQHIYYNQNNISSCKVFEGEDLENKDRNNYYDTYHLNYNKRMAEEKKMENKLNKIKEDNLDIYNNNEAERIREEYLKKVKYQIELEKQKINQIYFNNKNK